MTNYFQMNKKLRDGVTKNLESDMVFMLCLQWFSTGAIFTLQGHMTMSEDMIGSHNNMGGPLAS